ncbi:MAG TPA: hypothetical protein VFZ05_04750 [Nitrososphaera sp.]
MPLDRDIRETIESVIESDLAAPKVPKDRVPKLKKTWKCDNAHDFLYGHRAGYYKGLAEGMVIERHRRQLAAEEDEEVFTITRSHAASLRRYFAYYKQKHTKK